MKKAMSLILAFLIAASLGTTALAADFADVDSGAWYADAVNYVVSNKLMGGYNDTTFGPNDTLSRAMVVQVLYNKEGQPVPSGKHEFNDVPADQWFNNAVTWGTQKGVMGGYGNGKFGPNDNVTLEQLAVILWNYSGNPAFTGKADGVGAHSGWAANGLAWAVENNILANIPYTALTDGATRAQTAQMLTNYLSGNTEDDDSAATTSIAITAPYQKMGEDWTQYLTATISPAGAKETITWSSSNPEVATVDQRGKVSGVAGGETVITAKLPNGKTATCKIEVWHSHKLTSSTPATSIAEGVDVYTCAGCGHSYESRTPRRAAEYYAGTNIQTFTAVTGVECERSYENWWGAGDSVTGYKEGYEMYQYDTKENDAALDTYLKYLETVGTLHTKLPSRINDGNMLSTTWYQYMKHNGKVIYFAHTVKIIRSWNLGLDYVQVIFP